MENNTLEFNKKDPEVRLAKILFHKLHPDKMNEKEVRSLAQSKVSLRDLSESYYICFDCKALNRFYKELIDSIDLHLEDDSKAFITITSSCERASYTDFSFEDYGKLWYLYKEVDEY